MPDSYPFPTYSGLLESRHYKQIGAAIWLFLWCISSTTKEVDKEGITWGIVLGNKPMTMDELAGIFTVNEKTVRRWIDALEQHDYIKVTRAPRGLIFTVKNSKKFKDRPDKNVHLEQSDRTKMSEQIEGQRTEMSDHRDKNVRSNKDITEDITDKPVVVVDAHETINQLEDKFCEIHKVGQYHVKSTDIQCMRRVIAGGMPFPFIIRTMEQIYRERLAVGETIRSFSYYEEPLKKAWEKEQEKVRAIHARPTKSNSRSSNGHHFDLNSLSL